jgi:hypothetical protein
MSTSSMVIYGKSMYCPVCLRKFKGQEHRGGLPTVYHDDESWATNDCPNSGKVFVFPTSQAEGA